MQRDFTYIGDIVSGIISAIDNEYPFEIINLARGESIELMHFIKCIEESSGKKAKIRLKPLQPGDVIKTFGDITLAKEKLDYSPKISIEKGIKNFIEWYNSYYSTQHFS